MSGSGAGTAEPVRALSELRAGGFPGTPLAVLGHPIGHSLSPRMHNAALAALAEEDARYSRWHYHRFDVPPADLPSALEALARREFLGVNLTVPHKVLALAHVARVDPAAAKAGAVNTLLRTAEGWAGYNTDGYGLAAALRETLGISLAGRSVILLGAGGAARGAAVECLAQGTGVLAIGNRTRENLSALMSVLAPMAGAARLVPFDPEHPGARAALPEGAVVINATSVGLRPDDPAPVGLAGLPRPAAVFDMIYNPPETALLRESKRLGIPAANGLSMLVHQGAKALEIWSGVPAARTAPLMAAALAGA